MTKGITVSQAADVRESVVYNKWKVQVRQVMNSRMSEGQSMARRGGAVELNELLVNLFNRVMNAESKAVITEEFRDISNNDMHIMEAIGVKEPQNVSTIAGKLFVTVGTLTVNMNSLEKKGYIVRTRSTEDKRVVLVTLTEKGRKAFFHHRDFHKAMIHAAVKDLDPDEMKALINCLNKLSVFFEGKLNE